MSSAHIKQIANQKQLEARERFHNLLSEKAATKPNPVVHLLSRRFVCTLTRPTKYYVFFRTGRSIQHDFKIKQQVSLSGLRDECEARGGGGGVKGGLGFTLWKWYEVACVSQASPFLQIWLLKDGPPNSQYFEGTIFPTSSITPLWGSHSFQASHIHLFWPRNEKQNTHEVQKYNQVHKAQCAMWMLLIY